MKNCGVCNLCCGGYLEGEAYGNIFKDGSPCPYLQNDNCSIYSLRPDACRNYYCAWKQGLFSDNLFPPACGFIVSVENINNRQILKVIYTREDVNIDEVKSFCVTNNTDYVIVNK